MNAANASNAANDTARTERILRLVNVKKFDGIEKKETTMREGRFQNPRICGL